MLYFKRKLYQRNTFVKHTKNFVCGKEKNRKVFICLLRLEPSDRTFSLLTKARGVKKVKWKVKEEKIKSL